MSNNKNLHKAKKVKFNEYYTRLYDIEKELCHYNEHFRNKTVLCNCDDPYESNFFKYFAMNFNFLGLKKLICTCYDSSPVVGTQLTLSEEFSGKTIPNLYRKAYKIEITEVKDYNNDGAIDLEDVGYLLKSNNGSVSLLKGDGDFRSEECIELLKQADIVVTNPPFSLFREYVAQLVKFKKKFIIIGNLSKIGYKNIFPLFAQNYLWLGYNWGSQSFEVPMSFNERKTYIENGKKFAKLGNICWFTNIQTEKRKKVLELYKKYNPQDYPKYDNYDAINVNNLTDIPCDYDGVMGVPITFLDKYNPEQFEIVAFRKGNDGKDLVYSISLNNGVEHKAPFYRILIRRRH